MFKLNYVDFVYATFTMFINFIIIINSIIIYNYNTYMCVVLKHPELFMQLCETQGIQYTLAHIASLPSWYIHRDGPVWAHGPMFLFFILHSVIDSQAKAQES